MFLNADSTVALDSGHIVVAEYGILVHHAISPVTTKANNSSNAEESGSSSGEGSRARSTQELFVLSVYSVEVILVVEPAGGSASSLCGCVLLLVDRDGQVTAASEWIPV